MRNLIRALVLLPALAVHGCGGGGDSETLASLTSVREPGEEFLIGFGETMTVDSLSLEFISVEDSRCGVGGPGVCIWEGNAVILVSVTDGQVSDILTLNSNPKFPTSAIFAGRVIELRRLDPQPSFTVRPPLDEYTATLAVDGWMTPAG